MFYPSNMNLACQLEIVGISSINRHHESWPKYFRAADGIRKFPQKITSGTQAKNSIKHVDYEIAIRINSFVKNGTVMLGCKGESELPVLAKQDIVSIFLKVYGVDLEIATEWYNMGFHTLDDLSTHYMYLSLDQKIGLKYFCDLLVPIKRKEIQKYQNMLNDVIRDHTFKICGKYRRGCQQATSIKVLIKGNNDLTGNEQILSKIIGKLMRCKLLVEIIHQEHNAVYCLLKLSDRNMIRIVKFRAVVPHSWFTSVLYFTGPRYFVERMESVAETNNMTLNSQGLWVPIKWGNHSISSRVPIMAERDIFTKLSLSYVEPNERHSF